jgi:GTP-binding protein HflX
VLLSDTVGFVRRLPHGLVESFQSTLAEAGEADLLIHLVDGTDDDLLGQIAAVREVLEEIDAADVPELMVVNKIDALTITQLTRVQNLYPNAVFVSALKNQNLDQLLGAVSDAIKLQMVTLTLSVPYDRGDIVAAAHRIGEVIEEKHDDNGTIIDVRIPSASADRFLDFAR